MLGISIFYLSYLWALQTCGADNGWHWDKGGYTTIYHCWNGPDYYYEHKVKEQEGE